MRLSQVKANSGSVFGVLSVDNPPEAADCNNYMYSSYVFLYF